MDAPMGVKRATPDKMAKLGFVVDNDEVEVEAEVERAVVERLARATLVALLLALPSVPPFGLAGLGPAPV